MESVPRTASFRLKGPGGPSGRLAIHGPSRAAGNQASACSTGWRSGAILFTCLLMSAGRFNGLALALRPSGMRSVPWHGIVPAQGTRGRPGCLAHSWAIPRSGQSGQCL